MKNCFVLCVLLVTAAHQAHADATLLLQQPSLSAGNLAFVYAGDLWVANPDGSSPRQLTSSNATEGHPLFSPDGRNIAYSAEYEGNHDVFVIPTAGGSPRRLTWHPGSDIPTGWTPGGAAIALVSDREREHGRSAQLFHVALAGGLPQRQMEARIYRGSYDATGKKLAYIAFNSGYNGLFGGSAGWKGYRGGTTPAIQIMDLASQSVLEIPGAGATNFSPLWLGELLYFISDREKTTHNIYSYNGKTGLISRVSSEPLWDVRAISGHGSTIVYEAGGQLKRIDIATGATNALEIAVAPDLPRSQPVWRDVSGNITHLDISPTGKRVLATTRGEVFSLPVEDGSPRNLSKSAGVREYTALWSPGGDQVAWIVETLEGQTLVLEDQSGAGAAKSRRFELGPHFYELLAWSGGENPRIVYQDNHLGLHAMELSSGRKTRIASATRRYQVDTALSPDGAWLAYTRPGPNHQSDLILFNFDSEEQLVVTDGRADVAAPAFGRDGKYLYFAASTNAGPTKAGLNMSTQERPYRAGLYALVLAAGDRSPLLPKSGDENDPVYEEKEKEPQSDKARAASSLAEPTHIDTEALAQRIIALPVAERNYSQLQVASDGLLYFLESVQPGGSNEPPGEHQGDGRSRLQRFDFATGEMDTVAENIRSLVVSADGKFLLLEQGNDTLATAAVTEELEIKDLDVSGLRLRVDPRREWRQIFDEVWRLEKEYFYANNLHGLDWDAVYQRYLPLLAHVGRREDLNTLMVAMIAELQAGHNRVHGGDVYRPGEVNTGLLGADLEVDNGRYRLSKVYSAGAWHPYLKAPLSTPGNQAREGEYLLAINGQQLTAADNLFEQLQDTVGKQINLRVGPRADGRKARSILVEPVASERELRLWAWIETNRLAVDQATDGRVGYIYLPDTADAGYTLFNRMFFAQVDKEALIIDERSNSGGQAADYITEVLSRRHLSGWQDRDGLPYRSPMGAIHGPKLMLIDQDAGSGGDFLPYAFRQLGIGKLMGTRTWGGLIGIYANPDLVDGGTLTVPFFRFFDADMKWTIENEGVAPDLKVNLDPIAANAGRDTQLEAAVIEIMRQLESYTQLVPAGPPPLPTQLGK